MTSRARIQQHGGKPPPRGYDNPVHPHNGDMGPDAENRISTLSTGSGSQRTLTKADHLDRTNSVVELKKRVGLISGIALIVGTMIGSGIFISPKGVIGGSGSVGLSLVVWSLCGVIATLGALSLAELGTMINKSGAEYTYLLEAYGPLHKFVGPIPAFLFVWVTMWVLRPASLAIITLAFASYVMEPFFEMCMASTVIQKCLAALCILVLTVINCFSVRLATGVQTVFMFAKLVSIVVMIIGGFVKLGQVLITAVNCFSVQLATSVQIIFTVAKLLAIAILIVGGIVMLAGGNTQYLTNAFNGTESNPSKIAIGFYNGMWAYDGWNNLNYVTEEIINPYRNLPLAIIIAIPLVTVCYLLVNISYFTVMSAPELLDSPAVAVIWGNRILGAFAFFIPLSVAMSTFGAANGTLFTTGRLCFVAARDGNMVEVLSMVHVKQLTPLPSLVFTAIISLIMIIPSNIESLIDFFNFTAWMFYGGTMAALIVMRFTKKDAPRPFKVPIVVPILVLLVSIYLVVAPIIDSPKIEFLYAALFVVGGLIFYVPFVYFKIHPPFMDKVTAFLQLLMEVSPTQESTC